MTNFDIVMKALASMTKESAEAFKDEMVKVGDVFLGIKNECSDDQLEQLEKQLKSVSGCVDGLAEQIDKSEFLGVDDDELFAILFFQKILEQVG